MPGQTVERRNVQVLRLHSVGMVHLHANIGQNLSLFEASLQVASRLLMDLNWLAYLNLNLLNIKTHTHE